MHGMRVLTKTCCCHNILGWFADVFSAAPTCPMLAHQQQSPADSLDRNCVYVLLLLLSCERVVSCCSAFHSSVVKVPHPQMPYDSILQISQQAFQLLVYCGCSISHL